jgi:hypothetical protein
MKRFIGTLLGVFLLLATSSKAQTASSTQIWNKVYLPASNSLNANPGTNPNPLHCLNTASVMNATQLLNCVYDPTNHALFVTVMGGSGSGWPVTSSVHVSSGGVLTIDSGGTLACAAGSTCPSGGGTNEPTADQKAALAGTSGTPSATNKYVTDADARLLDEEGLDCSKFAGANDALKIQACFHALYAISHQAGIADASKLFGPWPVDPFDTTPIPYSGRLLMPPVDVQALYGPIVAAPGWVIQGAATRSVVAQVGSNLVAGPLWPHTYTTGTVTVGTNGANDVITGVGTNWIDNVSTLGSGNIAKGCAFVSPAGGGVPNDTFGVIKSVDGAGQITLRYGNHNGTGAPAGSTYTIFCPPYVTGDGGSTGDQYGMAVINMGIDGNNIADVGLLNWFGEQGTYADNVNIRNFCGIGFLSESSRMQNSGPWKRIQTSPGSCATAGTIGIVSRTILGQNFGLEDVGVFKSSDPFTPLIGIDVQGSNNVLDGVDSEFIATGISVGANTPCIPACAMPPRASWGNEIHNAYGNGTTLVHLSSDKGINGNTILRNLASFGFTNTLIDDVNTCTIPEATEDRLAEYMTDYTGAIYSSTSQVAGCIAPVTVSRLPRFGSAPAALLATKAAGADPATNNYVKWMAGGGLGDGGATPPAGVGPVDVSYVTLRDDFSTVGTPTTAGSVGMLGWTYRTVVAGSGAFTNGVYPNLGTYKLGAGAAAGDVGALALDSGFTGPVGILNNFADWDSTWIFSLDQTTLTRFRVGFAQGNLSSTCGGIQLSSVTANCGGIWLRYDTNTPAVVNITNNGITRASGVVTVTSATHSLTLVGQTVTIASATGCGTDPNGARVVTGIPSTTTWTFTQAGGDETCGGNAPATATPVAGTTFKFETKSGTGVATVVDTTVAADTNFHRLRIRSTAAGTILFTLYDAAGSVQTAETSIATTVPTTAQGPFIQIGVDTGGAATKFVNADFFGFNAWNLAR